MENRQVKIRITSLALMCLHILATLATCAWGYFDSRGSEFTWFFDFSGFLHLPKTLGNHLEALVYFYSILIFPLLALVLAWMRKTKPTWLLVPVHVGLSIIQLLGFAPLVS